MWRPSLADGTTADRDERLQSRRLVLDVALEPDSDADGYGDTTQDLTDLALAASTRRSAGRTRVRVVVDNRGRRRADQPRLTVRLPDGAKLWGVRSARCATRARSARCRWTRQVPAGAQAIDLPSLARRGRHIVTFVITGASPAATITAAAEGTDPTPRDATKRIR